MGGRDDGAGLAGTGLEKLRACVEYPGTGAGQVVVMQGNQSLKSALEREGRMDLARSPAVEVLRFCTPVARPNGAGIGR